jgi:hypothetical protein
MRSINDFLKAARSLPEKADVLKRSYKNVWIDWLSEYGIADERRRNPNRSPDFVYNALNSAEMIIWLAAVSGVDPRLIRKAAAAIDRKQSRMSQAAAVRLVLPWSLVSKHLTDAAHSSPVEAIIPDLDDIYRSKQRNTVRRALIQARLGQGQFRADVAKRWNDRCAVTGCAISSILRASHLDSLFDCGLISFADDGMMLVSAQIADELKQFNLPDRLRREPATAERRFLAYHRRYVFEA